MGPNRKWRWISILLILYRKRRVVIWLMPFNFPNFTYYLLINCVCNQLNYSTEKHFKIGQYACIIIINAINKQWYFKNYLCFETWPLFDLAGWWGMWPGSMSIWGWGFTAGGCTVVSSGSVNGSLMSGLMTWLSQTIWRQGACPG